MNPFRGEEWLPVFSQLKALFLERKDQGKYMNLAHQPMHQIAPWVFWSFSPILQLCHSTSLSIIYECFQEQPTIFFSLVLGWTVYYLDQLCLFRTICSFSSLASSFQQFLSSDSSTTASSISKHEVESSINWMYTCVIVWASVISRY